ncbi:MAG: hypothetical protein J6R89_05850, partial [Clostridia bacterium]|nr:hypothetical protein [Clostridia bacterium]
KAITKFDPKHQMLVIFENGKGVRFSMENYQTKSFRRCQKSAYSHSSPAVAAFYLEKPCDIVIRNNQKKAILVSSELVPSAATKTAGGNTLFTVKLPKIKVIGAELATDPVFENAETYRKRKVPAVGNAMTSRDVASFAERIRPDES